MTLSPGLAWAQSPAPAAAEGGSSKIRDNLFLMEEAYNQEPGVIQHISVFEMDPDSKDWSYAFTDEWPVPTDLHQLSLTIPLLHASEPGETGLGDLALNYRHQLLGRGGEGTVAIAPRLTILAPTGDHDKGFGKGSLGVQIGIPVSIDVGDYVTVHVNAGATVTPGAKAPVEGKKTTVDGSCGLALVLLPLPWWNLLTEVIYQNVETAVADGQGERESEVVVNPGMRWAIDVPGGLQIVPGAGAPISKAAGATTVSVLGYLSFEHPAF